MPALGAAEVMDVTPWSGWELTHGADGTLGPLRSPGGRARVTIADGILTLVLDGRAFLRTNVTGRFRRLETGPFGARLEVPPVGRDVTGARWVEFQAYAGREVLAARLDGGAVGVEAATAGLRIALPPDAAPRMLELALSGPSGGT